MNFLDYIIVALLVVFVVRGAWVGATRQILSIFGLVVGFWGASNYYGLFARGFVSKVPGWPYPGLTVFVVLFFVIWGIFAFLGYLFSRMFRKTPLVWADRLLGGSIGLLKTVLVAVIIISVLTVFLPPESPVLRGSRLAPYVQVGAEMIIKATPDKVKRIFNKKRKQLLEYWYKRERLNKSNKKSVAGRLIRQRSRVQFVKGLIKHG